MSLERDRVESLPSGDYWDYLDLLVATQMLVIDRPKGSTHPRYPDLVYPLDYGFLEGTTTVDGAGIDVWRGTGEVSLKVVALILTVDLKKKDSEIKIMLSCTESELQKALDFQNTFSMRAMLVRRSE